MGSVVHGVPVVLAPPDGYVVDFDHPQRQAVPLAYWVAGAGCILSLLTLAQRLYTKLFLMKKIQVDDVFLILAAAISYAVVYYCLHMFAVGAGGVHAWEIPITTYNIFMKDVYLAAAIYIVGGSLAKISLLIFYFRISPEKWFAWGTWGCIIFISGYTIGIFFAIIFACLPIEKNWDVMVTGGECINQASLYIATAVVNIFSDVIIFILPLPIVFHLQVPRRQKIGLLLIFLLGSLTIVTSCIRVSILPQMLSSLDQPWVISYATVWILVEANLFIICASLPTMRKFLKHVAASLIGESAYASGQQHSGYGTAASSKPRTGPGNSRLSTLDKSAHRRQYTQFDVEAAAGSDDDTKGPNAIKMTPYGDSFGHATAQRPSDEERTWVDDDSEQGIVAGNKIKQTTVITVERS